MIAIDSECWFNLSKPCGTYVLDLSCPYDRAVSLTLLRLSATHQRISITSCQLNNCVLDLRQVKVPVQVNGEFGDVYMHLHTYLCQFYISMYSCVFIETDLYIHIQMCYTYKCVHTSINILHTFIQLKS